MTAQEFATEQAKAFQNCSWNTTGRPVRHYMVAFNLGAEYIKKLDGKKLLLVGGGRSPIQTIFDINNIKCDVTNIDPYINDPKSANTICNKDFIAVNFVNEFDECWALYSLPLYSPDAYHAACFYARAAIALKPDGVLRVGGLPQYTGDDLPAHKLPCDAETLTQFIACRNKIFSPYALGDFVRTKYGNKPISRNTVIQPLHTTVNEYNEKFEYWHAPKSEQEKAIINEYMESKYAKFYNMHLHNR